MTRVCLLHRDRRIRELYAAVLAGRGYGVVACAPSEWTSDLTAGCEVLVVHVGDGTPGLLAAIEVLRAADAAVLAIDDDPELARDRALLEQGAVRVLAGPVRLRDLVDAVESIMGMSSRHEGLTAHRSLHVLRDSARHGLLPDVRGEQRRPGHHLVLTGDGLDISLHSFPRGQQLRVVGTVTGPEEPVLAQVRLDHASGTASTRSDPQGRFILIGVAPGAARLLVEARSCMVTAEVEVGGG